MDIAVLYHSRKSYEGMQNAPREVIVIFCLSSEMKKYAKHMFLGKTMFWRKNIVPRKEKKKRRPAVSVPCGAERRGNHNQKLKGS